MALLPPLLVFEPYKSTANEHIYCATVRTMTRLSHALVLFSLLYGTLFLGPVAARGTSLRSLNAKRLEIVKHRELSDHGRSGAGNARRATDTSPSRVKNITFSNPKASGALPGFTLSSLHLMHFQSSGWMVRPFQKSTLILARHGRA
jgi:hypothetical protein